MHSGWAFLAVRQKKQSPEVEYPCCNVFGYSDWYTLKSLPVRRLVGNLIGYLLFSLQPPWPREPERAYVLTPREWFRVLRGPGPRRLREPGIESEFVGAPGAASTVSGPGPRWLREPGTESVFVVAPGAVSSVKRTAPDPEAWERVYIVDAPWAVSSVSSCGEPLPMLTLPRSMFRNGRPSALWCSAFLPHPSSLTPGGPSQCLNSGRGSHGDYSHCVHNERVANSARFPRVMPRRRPCWACIDALRASAIKRLATQPNGTNSHDLPERTARFFSPLPPPLVAVDHIPSQLPPVDQGSRGYRP